MGEVPFDTVLHPRSGARRAGQQDVQVARQRHRPAGDHRQVRRGRAALHARDRQHAPETICVSRTRSVRGVAATSANKIWNASRFVHDEPHDRQRTSSPDCRQTWRSRTSGSSPSFNTLIADVTGNLDKYELGRCRFRSSTTSSGTSFCDWYIEICKDRVYQSGDAECAEGAAATSCRVAMQAAASVHAVHHRRPSGRHCRTKARPSWYPAGRSTTRS